MLHGHANIKCKTVHAYPHEVQTAKMSDVEISVVTFVSIEKNLAKCILDTIF